MVVFDKELFAINPDITFTTTSTRHKIFAELCNTNAPLAKFTTIGHSENHRTIDAIILGNGPQRISIVSGSHADEPVGSETLLHLIRHMLANSSQYRTVLEKFTFFILPHINPDGEARNQQWIQQWPQIESCLQHVQRELPGRDLEFGYPDLRIENSVVADFLSAHAPFDAHFSLHGMGFAEGCMLLIEPSWINRTNDLRGKFLEILEWADLPLHDHDRDGEKGFIRIAPGFTTTPNSVAMQDYFHQQNNPQMANKFKLSSMEFIRSLGGDPFCMVTELPLFIIHAKLAQHRPGFPAAYLKFRQTKSTILQQLQQGESVVKALATFQIAHVPLPTAMQIQLRTIEAALAMLGRRTRIDRI